MNAIYQYLSGFCLALLSSLIFADNLQPFSSDGCSAFPDGTLTQNTLWLKCCTAHDYDYWKGGTYQQRMESDQRLRECVSKAGEPAIAVLMLTGVRIGGSPFFPSSFRWGYGWDFPKPYQALTPQELKQIDTLKKADSSEKPPLGLQPMIQTNEKN